MFEHAPTFVAHAVEPRTLVLDMASLQAGRLTLERRPEDVEGMVREALDLHEPAARAKHIELERDTPR